MAKLYLDISNYEIIGKNLEKLIIKIHGDTMNMVYNNHKYSITHKIFWYFWRGGYCAKSLLPTLDVEHIDHDYYIRHYERYYGYDLPDCSDAIDKNGYNNGFLYLFLDPSKIKNEQTLYKIGS